MRISDWSSDVCSSDLTILESLTWRPPAVEIPPDGIDDAIERAGQALEGGNLAADAESAVPLFLALSKQAPDNPQDRKSVVSGKSVSVRVDLGGRRILKQKHQ